jgi:hypothetical protein
MFVGSVAVLIKIIAAFLMFKSSADEKVATLIAGCGESKNYDQCLILPLAGVY